MRHSGDFMTNKEVLYLEHSKAIRKNPNYIWDCVNTHVRSSIARFFSSRGTNIPHNINFLADLISERIINDVELNRKYQTMFQTYIELDNSNLKKIDQDVSVELVVIIEKISFETHK